ncbi:MAG TPA: Xaa-Pro peptidase family protein [Solirubrobacteraceae bacterium]|nr:Xaa-Pro peptidase family protein [Solirubrobacteraceae bacterium]
MSGPDAARVARLSEDLRARGLDALLVASLVDVRYLTGFTGSHGLVLISAQNGEHPSLEDHWFLTDFRYEAQSAEQVGPWLRREIVGDDALGALGRLLDSEARGGRLGFDDQGLTVAQHTRLGELLGERWELVPGSDAVRRLRAVKDAGEIVRIRAASELADEALRTLLEGGLVGRSEREVAIELERQMRLLGAQAPSFPAIVAAGAHAALPHAEPRAETIERDTLVTIDWGALHEGYCSDCTRTYATGEQIGDRARDVYALVLRAQRAALAAVAPGPSGRELDAVARAVIEDAGEGERFGHGLGHGVGLEVHEAPRLSRHAGEEPLVAGNVVTIEPGVYLPGLLGVRIEDLVVVGEDGCEVLTALPKELTVVS